jgi:hypothetical protein
MTTRKDAPAWFPERSTKNAPHAGRRFPAHSSARSALQLAAWEMNAYESRIARRVWAESPKRKKYAIIYRVESVERVPLAWNRASTNNSLQLVELARFLVERTAPFARKAR